MQLCQPDDEGLIGLAVDVVDAADQMLLGHPDCFSAGDPGFQHPLLVALGGSLHPVELDHCLAHLHGQRIDAALQSRPLALKGERSGIVRFDRFVCDGPQ